MKGYELFYNNFTVVTGVFYYLDYNNCKELQETGMYDYGARMLMPDLGIWGAMDAMSEKYSSWSPYNYAINNPVMVIDPDGNDVINTGAGMTATGADAQFAFKAYVATMSTSTESSGGNIFTGLGGTLGEDPKPGFWGRVSNWWDRLFGRNRNKVEVGQVERVSMSYGQTALFGLIRNANVNANDESPLEQYRTWRDNPLYHEGESWLDRFARNVNSSHMEILQDEGSGGGLMFGGYGKTIATAEKVSMTSRIAAEAEAQGFKSLNSGIDPAITAKYLEQMMNGTFNKPIGVAGFRWEGKFYLNDGNHRMNSAIQYKILTGDYKYMDILMNNAKWDNANPANYGKVYKFPVKPTR